ncbi:hypothetical protein J6590_033052 [Homalodisca vitripennis]|nr:hypothetical protein J6590_033052 [Homalodisca vitripennis]
MVKSNHNLTKGNNALCTNYGEQYNHIDMQIKGTSDGFKARDDHSHGGSLLSTNLWYPLDTCPRVVTTNDKKLMQYRTALSWATVTTVKTDHSRGKLPQTESTRYRLLLKVILRYRYCTRLLPFLVQSIRTRLAVTVAGRCNCTI